MIIQGAAVWVWQHYMYIFGGSGHDEDFDENHTRHYDDVWRFDFETLSWSVVRACGNAPPRRAFMSFAVGPDGSAYIVGEPIILRNYIRSD